MQNIYETSQVVKNPVSKTKTLKKEETIFFLQIFQIIKKKTRQFRVCCFNSHFHHQEIVASAKSVLFVGGIKLSSDA